MLWGTKGNSAKPSMPQMVWVWLLLFVLLFPHFCFSTDSRIDGDEQLQPHGGKSKSLKAVAALTVTPITSNSAQVESPHPYASSTDYLSSVIGISGESEYTVSFDGQTATEYGYDYIYIYEGEDTQSSLYSNSGSSFPDSITVVSSTGITFSLTSDDSVTKYGLLCTVSFSDPYPTASPTVEPTAAPTLYPSTVTSVYSTFNMTGYNDTSFEVTVCPGSTMNATCTYDNDQPILSLYNETGVKVDDDNIVYNNYSSQNEILLSYSKEVGGVCEYYNLHQVCPSGSTCSGYTSVEGATYLAPTAVPTPIPTTGPTTAPSYSDPSGYQVHVNSLDDGTVNEDACLSESGLSCTLRLQTLHHCLSFLFVLLFYYY